MQLLSNRSRLVSLFRPVDRLHGLDHLRRQDGIVALETFFSILFLVMVTILFWGVAAMLHNQAVLSGATQLAAQESLLVYDRLTYREDDPSRAQGEVQEIAELVYLESASSLIGDQFSSRGRVADPLSWEIACAPDYSSFSPANCGQGFEQGRVERVSTRGSAIAGSWLLDTLNSVDPFQTGDYRLQAIGAAYSAGPCARVNAEIRRLPNC